MCLSSQRRASAIGKFLVLQLRLTGLWRLLRLHTSIEIWPKSNLSTQVLFWIWDFFITNQKTQEITKEFQKITRSWEKWSCEYLQYKSLNFAFPPFLLSLPLPRTQSFVLSFLLSKALHTELQKSGYSHSESGTSPATTDLIVYLPSHQASFTQISPD